MIELKIPDDHLVKAAVAQWLLKGSEETQPVESVEHGQAETFSANIKGIKSIKRVPLNEEPTAETPAPPTVQSGTEAHKIVHPSDIADYMGVDVDSAGLPWDERIHSSSKSTIANGTWKKKRGVDPALVATVEAELRGEEPAAAAEPGQAATPSVDTVPRPEVGVVPPPPEKSPVDVQQPAITTFAELMNHACMNGIVDKLNDACEAVGVALQTLGALPPDQQAEKIPQIVAKL